MAFLGKKLPYPRAFLFDGQLRAIPHPRPRRPKKIIQALDTSQDPQKLSFPKAVKTTTRPQLPKYISAAFGSLDLPWKPGHLRSGCGAICCHIFKPKNITDDIFLAQIISRLASMTSAAIDRAMQKWYLDVRDMFAYVDDVLHPHRFDEIVRDDFAALRQMLQRIPHQAQDSALSPPRLL